MMGSGREGRDTARENFDHKEKEWGREGGEE